MPSTRTHFSFALLNTNAPVTAGVRRLYAKESIDVCYGICSLHFAIFSNPCFSCRCCGMVITPANKGINSWHSEHWDDQTVFRLCKDFSEDASYATSSCRELPLLIGLLHHNCRARRVSNRCSDIRPDSIPVSRTVNNTPRSFPYAFPATL